LKIFNFKTTLRDKNNNSFKSLSELSGRIKSIEKNASGHDDDDDDHKNQEEKECALYPGIKLPSKEFVMSLILDNPGITKDELVKVMLHRVHMRYHFPSNFKSHAHATGKKYELDEYEEYDPNQLNTEDLEILQKQRERRRQKGRILSIEEYDGKGISCEIVRDLPDGIIEPLTDSELEYFWLQPNSRWQDPNYHW
jgi:hypothetical protein